VQLTQAGQRLVDETRAPFEQIAQSFASVRDLAGAPRGLLRITAPVALARQQLVPRLAEFLRLHPEVRLELDMSDRLSSMGLEGFDLAIRHTAAPPDTHVAWNLCSTQTVLVATRSYLRRRGVPAAPADLVTHNCLHYRRGHDAPAWTFEPQGAQQETQRVTVPVSGSLSANNSEALRDAALASLGIALLPDFTAQASLRNNKLEQVLPEWKSVGAFAQAIYAIRPYSHHVPLAVSAFVSYLREVFSEGFGLQA
jgi:DNA-binding transcriptional LysR family regulator